jgi:hypothetical protein
LKVSIHKVVPLGNCKVTYFGMGTRHDRRILTCGCHAFKMSRNIRASKKSRPTALRSH